jgi:hypothetical protein
MKTTLEIPDEVFRQTKATAALRGESLKDFITQALEAHLKRQETGASQERGWRTVFGLARPEEIEPVSSILEEEFEKIEPEDWR